MHGDPFACIDAHGGNFLPANRESRTAAHTRRIYGEPFDPDPSVLRISFALMSTHKRESTGIQTPSEYETLHNRRRVVHAPQFQTAAEQ
jgi:hypothetical protein